MAVLNTGLQHCTFARAEMPEASEEKMHNIGSMRQLHSMTALHPNLKVHFEESMRPVIQSIESRFRQLTWKGNGVETHSAVTDEFIEEVFLEKLKADSDREARRHDKDFDILGARS